MSIYSPHAVLTCQYYILGPIFDDVSTVKVNFSLELNLQTPPPSSDSGFFILIVILELTSGMQPTNLDIL